MVKGEEGGWDGEKRGSSLRPLEHAGTAQSPIHRDCHFLADRPNRSQTINYDSFRR